MTFDTTIPVWGILAIIIPLLLGAIGALIRMWFKQENHSTQLTQLHEDQEEIRDLVIEKNEKTFSEIKKLESTIALQKESLIEIKTLLRLLIENKIKS